MMTRAALHSLLMLGLFLWSLAPALSFIYQTGSGAPLSALEICTAQGFAELPDDNGRDEDGAPAPARPACPFCAVAAAAGTALLLNAPALLPVSRPREKEARPLFSAPRRPAGFERGKSLPLRAPPPAFS